MSQVKAFVCPEVSLEQLRDFDSALEQMQKMINDNIAKGIDDALSEPGWKVTRVTVQWLNVRERLRNPDGDVGRWRVFVTRERA